MRKVGHARGLITHTVKKTDVKVQILCKSTIFDVGQKPTNVQRAGITDRNVELPFHHNVLPPKIKQSTGQKGWFFMRQKRGRKN